ncbi:MAG: hypothetical protein HRT45_05830 [Bdellovibrionales bacterium]|nr:hypothetical protein [Bdellovibrionales bacterium]
MKALLLTALNTFLDTTPRQWGFKAIRVFGRLVSCCKSLLSGLAQVELPKQRDRYVLYGSILAHSAVALTLMATKAPELKLEKPRSTEASVEFVAVSETELKQVSSRGPAPRQATEVIAKQNNQKLLAALKRGPKKKKSRVNDLGRSDSEAIKKALAVKSGKASGSSTKTSLFAKGMAGLRMNRAAQVNVTAPKSNAPAVKSTDLLKVINKHDAVFQSCYEKALLADEKLAGQAHFELKTDPVGLVSQSNIRFKGKGSDRSQSMLKGCLSQVSSKIRFAKVEKVITVRFQLLML